MIKILSIILLLLPLCSNTLWAQQTKLSSQDKMDTVYVNGHSIVILGDSSIYVEKDTIFIWPDSLAAKMIKDKEKRTAEFYAKLKDRLYKKRFTKELYKLLFKSPKSPTKTAPPKQPYNNFDEFKGNRIGKVFVKKLEIFGTSINDTTKSSSKWAIRTGNKLHVYTRSRVIKNNLFFKSGDRVDPDLITDSERIIRSLPFIRDSRIYLRPSGTPGVVDVIVVVKDLWSISFDAGFGGFDEWDFSLTERNFLGLGHELRNEIDFDERNSPRVGYSGTYRINNINSTFITADLNYTQSQLLDRLRFRIFRNFITPETRYAGGVRLMRQRELIQRIEPNEIVEFNSEFDNQDVWLGTSYLIDREDGARSNIQLAGRYSRTRFLDRPSVVNENTNQLFFDNDLYLFAIGYSKRSYEKSSLILGYGRTEDIPEGSLYEVIMGREINEFNERTYLAVDASLGRYFGRIGYIRPSVAIGGFYRDSRFEQGMFDLNVAYFSNLYRLRRTNFRQFFNLHYTLGIRRFDDEYINISNGSGVRGLSYVFLRGTKRLSLSSETVAFTPLYFLGFRMAVFGFVDFAIVNNEDSKLLKNKLYQGYGIGFRFRNENLAFNTIQIRLAWYPTVPAGFSNYDFDITGQTTLQLQDFRVNEPEVLGFQ